MHSKVPFAITPDLRQIILVAFQLKFVITSEISLLGPFYASDVLDKCADDSPWTAPDMSLGTECDGVTEVTINSVPPLPPTVTRKCDDDWVIGPNDLLCVKKSKVTTHLIKYVMTCICV